jgi:pimeloyl-ACP methyl ester carboxylesterase
LIIFSHANSFPASTYKVLFENLRKRGYTVKAVEKFGHDPLYPVSDNWPHVVQQLLDFAKPLVEKAGEPVWLVGHSLGGFLSLMAAARQPELVKGVVLIDSPILGGWRSKALGLAKTTQLVGSISPGAVSRRRRNSWPSVEAAFAHFRHKRAFAKWDAQMLLDYVTYGTVEHDGKRVLAFDRDIETQLYNTLPDNLDRLLARHPVKCPVTFIGGSDSAEMKQVGMGMTEQVTKGRTMMLDGSHLFPMEKPLATAAAIEAALRNMSH